MVDYYNDRFLAKQESNFKLGTLQLQIEEKLRPLHQGRLNPEGFVLRNLSTFPMKRMVEIHSGSF
jgi:hypothetical protein